MHLAGKIFKFCSVMACTIITLANVALLTTNVAHAEQEPSVQVSASFINMHTGPSDEHPIFYIAEHGEWIIVHARRTGFFKVSAADGVKGWVAEADMAKTLDVNGQPVVISPSGISGILAKFG